VDRRSVPARSAFAASVGYARAVRVGPHVAVAGTAPVMPGDAWLVEIEADAIVP
jgi:hypothetical protein